MKKQFIKVCSMLLAMVMVFHILPMCVSAEPLPMTETETLVPEESIVQTPTGAAPADTAEPLSVVAEIPEKRTEFSKEFLLSTGLHMAVVYPNAVHYPSETGWAEIDNTLKIHTDGTLRNTAGVWDVQFPQQLAEDQSISVTKDGYTLSFFMAGELTAGQNPGPEISVMSMEENAQLQTFGLTQAQTATAAVEPVETAAMWESAQYPEMIPDKNLSRLRYSNVYENTHVVYDLQSNTLKESVILAHYNSALRGYQYTLNVGQMVPSLEEDGTILFYDQTGKEIVMVMPAPYLMDFDGAYNDEITVQLTGTGSTRTLTYILPTQWLAAEDRAWPVILDPVIEANLDINNIRDITVFENETNWSPETTKLTQHWGMLQVGYYSTEGKTRTYLKYNDLPALTSSDVVVSASVHLYNAAVESTGQLQTNVHKVSGDWDSSTITWANKPGYDPNIEDYVLVNGSGWYEWYITDIVRDWYATGNTGMLFKASDSVEAAGTTKYKQFFSSDYSDYNGSKPVLQIFFRNDNGLESYWDYTAVSAGRAGTGYVNNYTGSLTWVRSDIGFSGNRMPISINHVYNMNDVTAGNQANNSDDTGGNYFSVGKGWRTNFHQWVYKWSEDRSYYIWEDADGTDHYFKLKDGVYKDEDNDEYTLTDTGSGNRTYCIKDKKDNCWYFDQYGRLSAIENAQQIASTITIEYVPQVIGQISRITDGAGRTYDFSYTNYLLHYISFMREAPGQSEYYIQFGYTGNRLTSVTYKDGQQCHYTYNDAGILTSVQDPQGYRVEIAHETPNHDWQPYKVTGLSESHDDNDGGTLSFEYGHNQTTVTDYSQNQQVLQFNDYGNLTCVQDNEGRAAFASFDKNYREQTSGKANQLRASSKLQTTVNNLVKDGGFEHTSSASGWGFTSTTGVSKARTTDTAYMGQASLKLDYSGVTAKVYALAPTIQVQPGETVTVSAYVKAAAGEMVIGFRKNTSGARYLGETTTGNGNWNRIQAVYTNTESDVVALRPAFGSDDQSVYYIDCLQVEKMPTASRYNLIENGDFSFGGSPAYQWTGTGLTTGDALTTVTTPAAPHLSGDVFAITGSPTAEKHLTYTIAQSGNSGDSYVFTGWAKGNSVPVPMDSTRTFGLILTFHNSDGTTTEFRADFNAASNAWQYTAAAAVADKAYQSITLRITYAYNANTAYFDGIGLFKETFSTSYTYDENGNLKSVTDLQKQTTEYEYNTNNDLIEVIEDGKAKMTYKYDNHHNVIKATTEEGLVYKFEYDDYGNNTKVSITEGGITMESSAEYSDDGNRLVSTTNALGKKTKYGYNEITGVLDWVQYPEDTEATRTEYTYDTMYRMATAACETDTGLSLSAEYTYSGDLLTGIETASTAYGFTYGVFDLQTGVTVGDRTLLTYHYTEEAANDRKYDLDRLDYGNGDSVQYEYDDQDRIIKETFEDGQTVTYRYDNDGALATVTDSESGITTTYYYDFTERMMKQVDTGTNYSHSVGYEYDIRNNLTKLVETVNGVEHTTTYTYDEDNRLTGYTTGDVSGTYDYDDFGRSATQTTKHNGTTVKTDTYTFTAPEAGNTSSQVQTHTVTVGGVATQYTYTHDDNGNITSVSDGTNTVTYTYDSANQLIREEKAGAYRHSWTYDNAGNILSRTEENWTNGAWGNATTYTYTYGDNLGWGDLLTAYNGQTITYDAIGNPLTDGTRTYTWKHGRQLATLQSGGQTWTFTYDASGMRTQRSRPGRTDKYVYNGSQLMQMKRGTGNTLDFTYDATGRPTAVSLNGTLYYYVTNLQGDITAIVDTTGATVVTYTYDAWGKNLAISGSMASTLGQYNPLRYRGYVYDQETGLYYLQSRYYDPGIGRFINWDSWVATGQGLLGNNMFAYCGNNPVMRVDPTGQCGIIIPVIIGIGKVLEAIVKATSEDASGTGAASEYKPTSSFAYDCYPYALGETESRDLGEGWFDYNGTNVYIVALVVLVDLWTEGRSARIISSYDSPITSNEYRIALRTGENGYHFMVQHSDGTWSHKPGMLPSRHINGANPSSVSWDIPLIDDDYFMKTGIIKEVGVIPGCYDSTIIYFAIGG